MTNVLTYAGRTDLLVSACVNAANSNICLLYRFILQHKTHNVYCAQKHNVNWKFYLSDPDFITNWRIISRASKFLLWNISKKNIHNRTKTVLRVSRKNLSNILCYDAKYICTYVHKYLYIYKYYLLFIYY